MSYETISHQGASLQIHWQGPLWEGVPTATLSTFDGTDATSGLALLHKALAAIKKQGITRVLGPMEGDTWHRYRFVSGGTKRAAFALEPPVNELGTELLLNAGFEPVSEYFSAELALSHAHMPELSLPGDITITTWDGQNPEQCFTDIHELVLQSFAYNSFYQPISKAAFLEMYQPILPFIRPEYLFLARDGAARLQGFLFAYPDWNEGDHPKSLVVKTYASLRPGLGRAMVVNCHKAAQKAGFETAIHALIHNQAGSAKRSAMEGAVPFRQYALYGKVLDDKPA